MMVRVLELILAVYRVTNRFPEGEVLIGQIRQLANKILADLITGHQEEASQGIRILLSYFQVAQVQNWLKPVNFEVLVREYKWLLEQLNKQDGYRIENNNQEVKLDKLDQRQKKIFKEIEEKKSLRFGKLLVLFPKLNPRTIRNDLSKMVKMKILLHYGKGRISVYKINKELIGKNRKK